MRNLNEKRIKNFKVLVFSNGILRNLKSFFNVLAFPIYTPQKNSKVLSFEKFRKLPP